MTFDQVGKSVAVFTTMCSRLARLLLLLTQCFLDDSLYTSLVGGVSSLECSLFATWTQAHCLVQEARLNALVGCQPSLFNSSRGVVSQTGLEMHLCFCVSPMADQTRHATHAGC